MEPSETDPLTVSAASPVLATGSAVGSGSGSSGGGRRRSSSGEKKACATPRAGDASAAWNSGATRGASPSDQHQASPSRFHGGPGSSRRSSCDALLGGNGEAKKRAKVPGFRATHEESSEALSAAAAAAAAVGNGAEAQGPPRRLNRIQLVMITFFAVCGGPFGIESMVGSAGPRLSLAGLLIVPWVWALPQALMTAELATAIPEMGGYVVWVHRAFGEAAGFQVGLWKVFESLLDLALYPVLLVSYLEAFAHFQLHTISRWLLSTAILGAVSAINVVGAETVGDYTTVFGVVVLMPFLLLFFLGAHRIRMDALLAGVPEHLGPGGDEDEAVEGSGVDWGVYLAILLWNTSGFDSAGTCAAEVDNPGKTYLPAMLATLVLTTLSYLLPLAVGVSVATDYGAWHTGHFVEVARLVGGGWLAGWIAAAGAVSALALLTSLLCTSSRALVAFADLGMAPAALGRLHPTYGTPYVSILTNSILTSALTLFDFEVIAEMAMCLYCLAMLAELLALAHLRVSEPGLARPYRIPVSDRWGMRLFVLSPCLLCVALVVMSGRVPIRLAVVVVVVTSCLHALVRGRGAKGAGEQPGWAGPYAVVRLASVLDGARSDLDAEAERLVPTPVPPGAGRMAV